MRPSAVARSGLARAISGFAGARVMHAHGDTELALPGQAIFYGNHSSHLDFLTIWAALPADLRARARPVAAKDYWGSGLRRVVVQRVFNAYLVDRHGSRTTPHRSSDAGVSPKGQISGMTEVLDAGDSLIIFPEGTRGDGETIAGFHGGLYRLAGHNTRIPVIPVTLLNLGRILPKGATIPVPHLSTILFGDPLYVRNGEDQDTFLTRARQVLVTALAEHRAEIDDRVEDDGIDDDGVAPDVAQEDP